jgi:hypothetical protein
MCVCVCIKTYSNLILLNVECGLRHFINELPLYTGFLYAFVVVML